MNEFDENNNREENQTEPRPERFEQPAERPMEQPVPVAPAMPEAVSVEAAFEAPGDMAANVGPAETPFAEDAFNEGPFYNETVKSARGTRRKRSFKRVAALVVAASMLGGAMLGLFMGVGAQIGRNVVVPRMNDDRAQTRDFAFPNGGVESTASFSQDSGLMSYAPIVRRVEPSTVIITSNVQGEQRFFNMQVPYEANGAGTGILFAETDANYYIATNAHVVEGANAVNVAIGGSEPVAARPVGKDARADLAVIMVSKADAVAAGVTGVTLAEFGNSDAMEPGDVVLAVGNSLGEGNIVTNGIISAKEKQITVEGRALTVMQTNAAINRGNSGGPLVNLKGEVIGINTAKLTNGMDGSVEGTGYAIPSNVAMPIITRLMQQGQNGAPILGIVGATLTEETAEQYNLPALGVLVTKVSEGYPAEKAGIQPGDIITGLDNEPVLSIQQLVDLIQTHKVGDKVTVKVIRDGKDAMTLTATLAENKLENF